MRILYSFQGTGNGHVARARDLVPRLAAHGEVDVLIAGTHSDVELGYTIKYKRYGLSMVYDSNGRVSYWKSFKENRILLFFKDLWTLPVKDYDLVIIDFEAITSYACKLRGVKALQLSHQAAYWSDKTPRKLPKVIHWEWVLKYMSPAHYYLGFHFQRYDSFILPPIIRRDVRELTCKSGDHYTVYLPAYGAAQLLGFFQKFADIEFQIFTKTDTPGVSGNCSLKNPDVEEYLQSFAQCKGLICGGGFEAPAEAMHHGKHLVVCPIQGQYEQQANAECARLEGVGVIYDLGEESKRYLQDFFKESKVVTRVYPDYAEALIKTIVSNARKGQALDNISDLVIW